MAKVTFNGTNKLIIVNNGETILDVGVDIYSDWKEWFLQSDNAKYLQSLRTIGGDPTVGGQSVAPYYFLMNGWRIRPYEGNHVLTVDGNLFVDGGGNPFVSTVGNYNVLINLTTSIRAVTIVAGSGLSEQEHTQLMNNVALESTSQNIKSKTDTINWTDVEFMKDVEGGNWKIENNQMVFYKTDGTTEIARFDLFDEDGKPAMKNVLERQRV